MVTNRKSILVIGFNTRPLAYSLSTAEYEVFAIDFFGDLDLFPFVKDSLILTQELHSDYDLLKESYAEFIPQLTLKLLDKYPNINYYIIGSGLDDYFDERHLILNEIQQKGYPIISLNNDFEVIKRSRDLKYLYAFLKEFDYQVPNVNPLSRGFVNLHYPVVLKKIKGSGGLNIYKVNNEIELNLRLKYLQTTEFEPSDWILQEFIDGIPISCTVISNGVECQIISINRQIIGEKFVNAPKEFIYCGNIVPANLLEQDNNIIKEISMTLAKKLNLKGINGFDFVLKNHYPYLMEVNPRIPGSIRVSEETLNLNLLDLHVKSFDNRYWKEIKDKLQKNISKNFATKLIFFAPKMISKKIIARINTLKFIHDKSDPKKEIPKNAPICSILYKDNTFASSYFGALKIADKIKEIISSENSFI